MGIDAHTLTQGFATEGFFVALPLAVPHESLPLDPDDSRVQTLCESETGLRVYGATRGKRCHLFTAACKGTVGTVLDVGVLAEAEDAPCLFALAGTENGDAVIVGTNTTEGACFSRTTVRLPGDTIQEPGFGQPDFALIAQETGTRLVDGVRLSENECLYLTTTGVSRLSLDSSRVERVAETDCPPTATLVSLQAGEACWLDAEGHVCRFLQPDNRVERTDLRVPVAGGPGVCCGVNGTLIHADAEGRLRRVDLEGRTIRELGATAVAPVQCLAGLPDGRIYGMCGDGICRFFRANVKTEEVVDLGAVAAVLGAIRYGFEFADALTGREGNLYFAEADRGGHLWLYFPPLG